MTVRKWTVVVVACAYPVALLTAIVALRLVGERWWVTGVGLYLPRLLLGAPMPIIVIALFLAGLRRLLWTQLAAAALFVFPLMGFVIPWPASRAPDRPVMRVLSYNVNSASGGATEIVAEINKYSPDVVLLQETGGSETITRLLRERYPTVEVANQFLLATRYTLVSTTDPERLEYDGHRRSPRFIKHVLDTPLGEIVVYNVHPLSPREAFYALRGPHGLRREILSGRLFSPASSASFQANSGLRALQVEAIGKGAQRETEPVLMAGDTNLPGLSWVLNRYLSIYQDGFRKAGWGLGYTFPTTPRHPWMRIDRILASDELRFVRFEVGTSHASDHLCVVADIQGNP